MKSLTKSNFLIIVILSLLLLYGGILRFYHLSYQSYWMDEGYTINAVLSIQENNLARLDSRQTYQALTYYYPTAVLAEWLGNSPTSYRLFSAITGLLFIIVIYLITNNLFNQKIALLTSFFTTFSYWHIAWSRQARFYTLFTLLFWLALFFFYKSLYFDKKKYLNIGLMIVFSSLAILTTTLGCLLPLIFVIWVILDQVFIKQKIDWKKIIVTTFAVILSYFIIDFVLGANIYKYIFSNSRIYYALPYYLSFYLRNYWLFIPLAIVACIKKDNQFRNIINFLLYVACIYFIALSFFTNIVHYRYLFHLTPILFIFCSVEIINLHDQTNSKIKKIIMWLITLTIFFTIAGGVLIPQAKYFLESDNPSKLNKRPYYAYTPQPDWTSAYDFIQKNIGDNGIVISSQPQLNKIFLNTPGYWIKYNYLGYQDISEYNNNGKEYYVGASIINNVEGLKHLTERNHGLIIFDYMSIDNRISKDIINYIKSNFILVFNHEENFYSKIWIYKF